MYSSMGYTVDFFLAFSLSHLLTCSGELSRVRIINDTALERSVNVYYITLSEEIILLLIGKYRSCLCRKLLNVFQILAKVAISM